MMVLFNTIPQEHTPEKGVRQQFEHANNLHHQHLASLTIDAFTAEVMEVVFTVRRGPNLVCPGSPLITHTHPTHTPHTPQGPPPTPDTHHTPPQFIFTIELAVRFLVSPSLFELPERQAMQSTRHRAKSVMREDFDVRDVRKNEAAMTSSSDMSL